METFLITLEVVAIAISIFSISLSLWCLLSHREKIFAQKIIEFRNNKQNVVSHINKVKDDINDRIN